MTLKGGSFLTQTTDPNSVFTAEEWNEEQWKEYRAQVEDLL